MFGLFSKKKVDALLKEKDEELEKLRDELVAKESVITQALDRHQTELSENDELRAQLKTLEDKNENSFKKVEELSKQKDQLTKDLEEIEDDLKKERQKSKEKKEELEKLRNELIAKESVITQALDRHQTELSENDKLRAQLKTLEDKNKNSLRKVEELSKQNDQLSKDLEKSKKDLEDAEDVLEDIEYDLKKERQKSKEKKEEFSKLQKKFYELEKDNKQEKEKLDKSEKKVAKQEDTIKLKNSSLDFVKVILNAKEELSESSGGLNFSKVDAVVDYVLGDFRDCVNEFFEEDPDRDEKFFNGGLRYWAATSKKTWLKNKTTVAFVGEFSAGKTSIVNKILSQSDSSISLPVGIKATTAIPTYISNSDSKETSFKFFTPDNKLKLLEKTFKQVNKEILAEVDGISNLIKYFVMTCDNKNLSNLSILDTPGFTSNDKEDAIRTIDVINECDALFWVFDVNAGTVNRASLKIIKENLQKPLFVVINKVDTKAPGEVDKVENLIRKTFNKEGINVQDYIRFSYNDEPSIILDYLNKVPSSNETLNYTNNLLELASILQKRINDSVSEWGQKKAEYDVEVTNAFDIIDSSINKVKNICNDINNTILGSFKKHIIGSNKYELSPAQFTQMQEDLSKLICYENRDSKPVVMKALLDAISSCVEATKNRTDALNKYLECKSKKERFDECVKQLKKRISAFSFKIEVIYE